MRKHLVFILLTFAVTLAYADFREIFNASLTGGDLQSADSILTVWSNETPDDSELYAARFNLLLNRARSEMLVLSDDPSQNGEALVLTDSAGGSAGYLYDRITWQDSIVNEAFAEIDSGIAMHPDRIDFWLGKASAATMTEHWDVAVRTLDRLLDREKENGGRWLTTGGADDVKADSLLADAVFERVREIYTSESRTAIEAAMPVIRKATQRFDSDVRLFNIAGAISFGLGNDSDAVKYFEEALRIDPADAVPLTNMASMYYQKGDTVKALEICRQIESGNYDEDSRKIAIDMILDITSPVNEMKEYFYFFSYLPQISESTNSPTDFLNEEFMNSRIPAYNKLRSPFADADIKAEAVSVKGLKTEVVVWTFPMPHEIPMCRYVAFAPDGNGGCRIFTLEKSLDDCWVIGTQDDTSHSNFGDIELPSDAVAFVKALRKKKLLN